MTQEAAQHSDKPKRPRGRPRKNPPPLPNPPTGRYVECAANRTLHEPRLVPLFKGPKSIYWRCPCTSNGFMAKQWKLEHGYTQTQAEEMRDKFGWIICGC